MRLVLHTRRKSTTIYPGKRDKLLEAVANLVSVSLEAIRMTIFPAQSSNPDASGGDARRRLESGGSVLTFDIFASSSGDAAQYTKSLNEGLSSPSVASATLGASRRPPRPSQPRPRPSIDTPPSGPVLSPWRYGIWR